MDLKTVIVYRSKHHGNTKKLVDAIVAAHPDIDTVDVGALGKNEYPDLSPYHIIVMASGIYYGSFDKDLLRVADHCLRDGDKVVGLMTYGGQSKYNGRDLDSACRLKFANLLCMYGCPGFDTYGPFKFVGGMNKDRPNQEDIDGAVAFYDRLVDDYGEIIIEERIKRDKQDAFNAAHPAGGLLTNIKRTAKKIANRGKKKDGADAPAAGQQEAAHAHDAADSAPSQAPEAAQNGNSDPSGSAEE